MLMFEMSKFSGKKESYVIDILNNIHFLFLYIKFIFSSVVNMHFFNCQKVMKKNLGQSLMTAKMKRKSNKYIQNAIKIHFYIFFLPFGSVALLHGYGLHIFSLAMQLIDCDI